jgi:hypothetical protein
MFVPDRRPVALSEDLTLPGLEVRRADARGPYATKLFLPMLAEVDYLLLLDKLYILSSGFVVLTLAVIVRNSWVDATGDVARAARADRRGLAVLTACSFGAAALISVFSLT